MVSVNIQQDSVKAGLADLWNYIPTVTRIWRERKLAGAKALIILGSVRHDRSRALIQSKTRN